MLLQDDYEDEEDFEFEEEDYDEHDPVKRHEDEDYEDYEDREEDDEIEEGLEDFLVSCPRNNISFAEGTLSRGREARRRRCCGIVDDERQRDRPKFPPPFGLRAQQPCFFVAPPRRCRTSTRRRASNQNRFARNKWHVIPGTGH